MKKQWTGPPEYESWPSVTTILKLAGKGEALENWKAKKIAAAGDAQAANKYASAAGDRGTFVDEWIKATLEGRVNAPVPDDWGGYTEAAKSWIQGCNVRSAGLDVNVWHLAHRYRGTIDAVVTLGGEDKILVDFKTVEKASSLQYRPYDTHCMQVAAYTKAYEEAFAKKVDYVGIVRFTGDGEYKIDIFSDEELFLAQKAFLGILDYYNFREGYNGKKEAPGPERTL